MSNSSASKSQAPIRAPYRAREPDSQRRMRRSHTIPFGPCLCRGWISDLLLVNLCHFFPLVVQILILIGSMVIFVAWFLPFFPTFTFPNSSTQRSIGPLRDRTADVLCHVRPCLKQFGDQGHHPDSGLRMNTQIVTFGLWHPQMGNHDQSIKQMKRCNHQVATITFI